VDLTLVRDQKTGKPRGFCFLAYEDQRSTILAVDNFNGAKVCPDPHLDTPPLIPNIHTHPRGLPVSIAIQSPSNIVMLALTRQPLSDAKYST
jgi:RNA recognition motif-containing protein